MSAICPHVHETEPACPECVAASIAARKREKAVEDRRDLEALARTVSGYAPPEGARRVVVSEREHAAKRRPDFGRHTRSPGDMDPRPLDFDAPHFIGRRFTGGRDIGDFVQDPKRGYGPRRR